MNKRGAIELSFGMIFSIIIMIAIIGVAVYAITSFLQIGKTSQISLFHQKFQNTVDEIWSSSITNKIVSFSLPSSIELICFGSLIGTNYNPLYERKFKEFVKYSNLHEQRNTNRFLYPIDTAKNFAYSKTEKIDVTELTGSFDCFEINSGNVKIRFEKNEFDSSVKIKHE
ncbi:hypothetical protein EXS72_02385 [Candidatus Pacearchaeota archaeon]|nr:hypothetical protein [Candidatus Pacearchaeota archaeon]